MVAEKVNNAGSLGLCDDIRPYALAHQLERPGERDPTLLPVAPGGAIIDASRQAVQLGAGKGGRLPDVAIAAFSRKGSWLARAM